jgi:hypothetical protein
LDDDELVYSNISRSQRTTCRASLLRTALRKQLPEWSNEEIEEEIFKRVVPKGGA